MKNTTETILKWCHVRGNGVYFYLLMCWAENFFKENYIRRRVWGLVGFFSWGCPQVRKGFKGRKFRQVKSILWLLLHNLQSLFFSINKYTNICEVKFQNGRPDGDLGEFFHTLRLNNLYIEEWLQVIEKKKRYPFFKSQCNSWFQKLKHKAL